MEERYHIPLVLCCAEENEVALVRVLDELHKEGRAPEVVAGVDVDVDLLGRAVDRTDGPALFVLCQSDELDRAATRRLAGLFSARKAPEHRIITVQLTPQRPLSILPPIRTALKDLLRAQYEKDRDGEEGKALLRDVVGPTPVTAVDRKGPDPEELARRLHKEMLAAEALLDRRDKGKPRGRGDVIETTRARSGSSAARRVTPDVVAYSGEPGAPQVQMEEESAGMPSLLPALGRVPEVALTRQSPDTVQTDFTPTHARVRRREPSADPMPRSVAETTDERPGSRVLLFVAIAGITALALMAVLHMSGDDEGPARRQGDEGVPAAQRRGTANAGAEAGGASASAGNVSAEGGASAGAASAGADGGAAEGGASAGGVSAGGASAGGVSAGAVSAGAASAGAASAGAVEDVPDAGEEEGAAAEAGVAEEPAVEEGDDGADDNPRALVPPPPRRDNEALVIDQAIADGKIRSLDALLVLKTSTDAMTWSEASDVCRSRVVSTIRGWHLPSTTEIKRLRRSRMLGALTYWTRNRNAAKDEAFALDNTTGRVNLYLTVEPVARPVCVRSR
jgi:hypothetical protein